MNDALAQQALADVLKLIDEWGSLYDLCWGKNPPYTDHPEFCDNVDKGKDNVRAQTRFAHDIVLAMGENNLAEKIVEYEEGHYGGHPYSQARNAIVVAMAVLDTREALAEITGPAGPQLSASHLHPAIWGAAARLWDDGHYRQAVQTAGAALEGFLQGEAGTTLSGADLGTLFSLSEPTEKSPRLRLHDVENPTSDTFKSAHEGAAFLTRGAFQGVRNLMSHPEWPDPTDAEALEMLAVLSYVAHLALRSDTIRTKIAAYAHDKCKISHRTPEARDKCKKG